MRARFISTSPPGSLMLQISVAQLYDDNRDKLGFAWIGGKTGGATKLWRDSTGVAALVGHLNLDRKSTRLNSSHGYISYAVFCLKKKKKHIKKELLVEPDTHVIQT